MPFIEIDFQTLVPSHFVQAILEAEHEVAPHGIGTGFAHVVKFADAHHILVPVQQVVGRNA